MTSQAKKVKNQILASKISVIRSLNNEKALQYELNHFFQELKRTVLHELEEYYNSDFMFQGHADLILAPIFEAQQEYYNILRKFNSKEYQFGRKEGRRLVKLARRKAKRNSLTYADKASQTPSILTANIKKEDDLFGINEWSEQELLNRSFTASEKTMNRIDSDINKILSNGYREGKGINEVRNDITKRFDQLSSWEATRIARTEIHNAHNMGTMDIYQEMGVEYTQWIAAHDARTRTSHKIVDREIIPMGGTYSNDLRYPGDTSGPIEEWINCRCSNAPFIIPDGYMAPSFTPFKEKDLIPTLDYWNQDDLMDTVKKPIINFENSNLKTHYKLNSENQINSRSLINKTIDFIKEKREFGLLSQTKVYKDIRIIKRQNTNFIKMDEIEELLDYLPEILLQNVETIKIYGFAVPNGKGGNIDGWVRKETPHMAEIFRTSKPKNTIVHELAHILDNYFASSKGFISRNPIWNEAYKLDKKYIKKLEEEYGFEYEFDYYVSKYSLDHANLMKDVDYDDVYGEDFAESVMRYLDSNDNEFKDLFPNRCKVLKFILGV